MIDKHALLFSAAATHLVDTKWTCHDAINKKLTDEAKLYMRNMAVQAVAHTKRACIMSEMDDIIPETDRLAAAFDQMIENAQYTPSILALSIKHLVDRIHDGLANEFYFHVTPQDVPLYQFSPLFGEKVSKKFTSAGEDVEEAGKCLALQRSTAAVFHLMRVMEHGVQALGKKLKVSIDVQTETWYQIMEHVDGAIRKLPAKTGADKKKKAALGAASATLNAVRIAWRNEVMHPKQTYSREQAHDVFNATRAFMTQMAELV